MGKISGLQTPPDDRFVTIEAEAHFTISMTTEKNGICGSTTMTLRGSSDWFMVISSRV
jgi:hypothetical protein